MAGFINLFAHGLLLEVRCESFIFLKARKALDGLAVPLLFVNVLDVRLRQLFCTAKQERSLFHRDFTRSYSVCHDSFLLVQLMVNWLQSIADDIAAYQELFLEETEVFKGAWKICTYWLFDYICC